MYQFKILIEGYAYPGENSEYIASSSSVLIWDDGIKILADPGTNSKMLIEALIKENLKPEDIDLIYLTHYHPDHFLNIRLFPGKDIFDGTTRWSEDKEFSHSGKIPDTEIEILNTPGHAQENATLLFETEKFGKVCLASDVFWWETGKQKSDNYDDLIDGEDQFASDFEALKNSRKLILEKADWIIPGHGEIFKNPLRK